MAFSPEIQLRLNTLRKKSIEGTLALEEMREVVILLRQERTSAAQTSAKSRAAKAKPVEVSGDDLLSELDGI